MQPDTETFLKKIENANYDEILELVFLNPHSAENALVQIEQFEISAKTIKGLTENNSSPSQRERARKLLDDIDKYISLKDLTVKRTFTYVLKSCRQEIPFVII